jgi:ribosomal protein S18 acetylase RimI-like enzyme
MKKVEAGVCIQYASTPGDLIRVKKLDKKVFNDSISIDYSKKIVMLAILDKKIVGFAAYSYKIENKIKYLYVDTLLVDPEHQGKKIGSMLLTKLINATARPMLLHVAPDENHDRLIEFYKRFKFVLRGKSAHGSTRMIRPARLRLR